MKKTLVILLSLAMVFAFAACTPEPAPAPAPAPAETPADTPPESTFPEDPIELVACYSPGGGHDILLRTMLSAIVENNLSDGTFNVVNKDGGSGATGMAYVNGKAGNDYYLMCATSSFVTTPLSNNLDVTYENFTPIALLGLDPSIIVVRADSGITDLDGLLATPDVSLGGTGQGTIDHIITTKLMEQTGAEINYIPYQGDGEQVTSLLGSQVTCICCNYNTVSEYIENGDFICIATFTPERLEANPDVATAVEQGYDIEMSLFRGVVAPAGISEEAKAFYIDLMTKLNDCPAWKEDYLDANGVVQHFLTGDDFKAYLDQTHAEFEAIMTELGLI